MAHPMQRRTVRFIWRRNRSQCDTEQANTTKHVLTFKYPNITERDSRTSREISWLPLYPNVNYSVHTALYWTLFRQINTVHILTYHIFNIQFNIILSTSRSAIKLSDQLFVCVYILTNAFYIPRQSQLPGYNDPNNIWLQTNPQTQSDDRPISDCLDGCLHLQAWKVAGWN